MSRHLKTISVIAALAIAALGASAAQAQTCTVGGSTACFVASKLTGESPLATSLTWNVPGAATCSAGGGGTQWSGTIACSGTKNLTGLTSTQTLTIDSAGPSSVKKFRLKWVKPTQNTDGSALTNLGGYSIQYGTSASALNQTVSIPTSVVETLTPTTGNPQDSAYTFDGLAAGTWFAALVSRNSNCFATDTSSCRESAPTAAVSQTLTTTPGTPLPQLSLTIAPFQVPKAPTGLVATEVIAYLIEESDAGGLVASRVEMIPVSTICDGDHCNILTRLATGEVQR